MITLHYTSVEHFPLSILYLLYMIFQKLVVLPFLGDEMSIYWQIFYQFYFWY